MMLADPLSSTAYKELMILDLQTLGPIARLKTLSQNLPRQFKELEGLLVEHERTLENGGLQGQVKDQRQMILLIIEKIIEILEKDHKELIDAESFAKKENHELVRELIELKSLKGIKAAWYEKDELHKLKKAVRVACRLLHTLHGLRKTMILEENYKDRIRGLVRDIKKAVDEADYFFSREAVIIGDIENDHAKVRELLAAQKGQ